MESLKKVKTGKKLGELLLSYALYIILVAILLIVSIIKPNFVAVSNLLAIIKQASTKGILALGCAGLIVLAGTDLSIGRVLGLAGAVTASLVQATYYSARYYPQFQNDLPLIVPFLAAIAIGVLFAAINGFGVAYLHMHAFIITLGTQLIAYGANCLYIEGQPSGNAQALSTFNTRFLNVAAGDLVFAGRDGNLFAYTSGNGWLLKIPMVIGVIIVIAFGALILLNLLRPLKAKLGEKMGKVNLVLWLLIAVMLIACVGMSLNTKGMIAKEQAAITADVNTAYDAAKVRYDELSSETSGELQVLLNQRTELRDAINDVQNDVEQNTKLIAILKGEATASKKQQYLLGEALTDATKGAEAIADYEAQSVELDSELERLNAEYTQTIADYDAAYTASMQSAETIAATSAFNNLENIKKNIDAEDFDITRFTSAMSLLKANGTFGVSSTKIPLVVIYFLLLACVVWVIWNKTRLGKNMFAVGGNTEAAAVSGVNVARTIMMVYVMAGVLYGIASFLEAGRIQSVGANTGINYECDAISACVIGGVSFSGGVGTVQGVVIGAVILQAINFSLNFIGVNPYYQYIIRGAIIVLAVAIDVRKYLEKK